MKTKIIEATSTQGNWGKFLVGRMDEEEWARQSAVDGRLILFNRGWSSEHLWVMDLQTGEGALFRMGGLASADLNKHRIWVCPLFEHFLAWLYKDGSGNLDSLPDLVDLGDIPLVMFGYRRPGRGVETLMEEIASCEECTRRKAEGLPYELYHAYGHGLLGTKYGNACARKEIFTVGDLRNADLDELFSVRMFGDKGKYLTRKILGIVE